MNKDLLSGAILIVLVLTVALPVVDQLHPIPVTLGVRA